MRSNDQERRSVHIEVPAPDGDDPKVVRILTHPYGRRLVEALEESGIADEIAAVVADSELDPDIRGPGSGGEEPLDEPDEIAERFGETWPYSSRVLLAWLADEYADRYEEALEAEDGALTDLFREYDELRPPIDWKDLLVVRLVRFIDPLPVEFRREFDEALRVDLRFGERPVDEHTWRRWRGWMAHEVPKAVVGQLQLAAEDIKEDLDERLRQMVPPKGRSRRKRLGSGGDAARGSLRHQIDEIISLNEQIDDILESAAEAKAALSILESKLEETGCSPVDAFDRDIGQVFVPSSDREPDVDFLIDHYSALKRPMCVSQTVWMEYSEAADPRSIIEALPEQLDPQPPERDVRALADERDRFCELAIDGDEPRREALSEVPLVHAIATMVTDGGGFDGETAHPNPETPVRRQLTYNYVQRLEEDDVSLDIDAGGEARETGGSVEARTGTDDAGRGADGPDTLEPVDDTEAGEGEPTRYDGGEPLEGAGPEIELFEDIDPEEDDEPESQADEASDAGEADEPAEDEASTEAPEPAEETETTGEAEPLSSVDLEPVQVDDDTVVRVDFDPGEPDTPELDDAEEDDEGEPDEASFVRAPTAWSESGDDESVFDTVDGEAVPPRGAIPEGPAWQNHLQEAGDATLNHEIRRVFEAPAIERPDRAHGIVAERQRRMLCDGQQMAAWGLTHVVEEAADVALDEYADPVPVVPAWVCRLALYVDDPRAHLLESSTERIVNRLYALRSRSLYVQRTFLAWLALGQLTDGERFSRQLAEDLPEQILEQDWLANDRFFGFLCHYVVDPEAAALHIQLQSARPRNEIVTERNAYLDRARQLVDENRNTYFSGDVSQYWRRLVDPEGAVKAFLEEIEQGGTPDEWPEVREWAEQVEGWNDIIARLQRNIIGRLEDFLDALRHYVQLRETLNGEQAHGGDGPLRPDDLSEAIEAGRRAAERLQEDGEPGQVPVRRIVDRLEDYEEKS